MKDKPLHKSKKALWSLIVVVLSFLYLKAMIDAGAPWESHKPVWSFLGTLAIAYLASQAAPDTAKRWQDRE